MDNISKEIVCDGGKNAPGQSLHLLPSSPHSNKQQQTQQTSVSIFRGYYKTVLRHQISGINVVSVETVGLRRFILEGNLLKWYNYDKVPHDHIEYEERNVEGCEVESFITNNSALPYAFKILWKNNTEDVTIYADADDSKNAFMAVLRQAANDKLWGKQSDGSFSIVSITPVEKSWRYLDGIASPIVTIHNDSPETIHAILETGREIYETVRIPIEGEKTAQKLRDSIKKVKVPSIFLKQTIAPGCSHDFMIVNGSSSTHLLQITKQFHSSDEKPEQGEDEGKVVVTGVFVLDKLLFSGAIHHITRDDLQTPLSVITTSKTPEVAVEDTRATTPAALLSNVFQWLVTIFKFFMNVFMKMLFPPNKPQANNTRDKKSD
jgi:hypothetical protein